MDLFILSQDFDTLGIIDTYKSLIWTDRYSSCGDFEIVVTPTTENMDLLQFNRHVWREDSEHVMIIESLEFDTDVESGHQIIVKGRSMECIIDRRIVWTQTRLRGNLQGELKRLFNENLIAPSDPNRKIDRLVFQDSTDPLITSLQIDKQFTGDNIYEALTEICDLNKIGFIIRLTENNQMAFQLYAGVDRSYKQIVNPHIVFSPGYENLISSTYVTSDSNSKTVALVAGEDQGGNRRTAIVGDISIKGINRRELYVDARDLQSENEDGTTIPDAEYIKNLQNRGEERMLEYKVTDSFDGEVSSVFGYLYGIDYFLGDICQIENQFGIQKRVRVVEFIRSKSDADDNSYPTFEVIE